MNVRQYRALSLRETDVDGTMRRLRGDEALYTMCLDAFLTDPTIEQLNISVENDSWDEAFTAAHALKGVAGNMGFVPLMHNTGQLIVLLRGGRIKELSQSLAQVNSAYRDIVDGIRQYFAFAGENRKEDAI